MQRNYSNKDFEQFVKQNADQYRMFPSEKVWKNIHNALHTRRKWYGAGLAFLLLLTGSAVTWVMVTNPASQQQSSPVAKNQVIDTEKPVLSEGTDIAKSSNVPGFDNQLILFKETSSNVSTEKSEKVNSVISNNSLSSTNLIEVENLSDSQRDREYNNVYSADANDLLDISLLKPEIATAILFENNAEEIDVPKNVVPLPDNDNFPLAIESVTNSYQPKNGGKKLSWQFFIAPTISYRRLKSDNPETNLSSLGYPYAPRTDNVNNAVTHRPDLGLQIGVSAGYPVAKNFNIRGGLQFNINRYDIKAFAYNPELATINLNDSYGSSISAWTNYRNYGGYRTNWLKNFYFSVSAPIGAELKVMGNEKTSWGIAGTVQPTYIIKDRAYLISTDYKNYAKIPWLVRRVNVNTSFETFITTGTKTKWQIGPQVRYQVLSSFQNKYPVKEHLFDFGLKVGVFLNE